MIVTIPYKPREAFKAFHGSLKRWNVLLCHRAAGKSVACVNHLIRAAIKTANGVFTLISPTFRMAKRSIWPLFHEYADRIPGVHFNEAELLVTFGNGSRIYLLGSDNPHSIRGIHQHGCVMDEYQLQSPSLFGEIIVPTLATHSGSAVFIGTTLGRNQMWKLYDDKKGDQDWYSLFLPASKSGILSETQLQDARANMTEEQYLQEYELEPTAALTGAIWGNEMRWLRSNGRIGSVPLEEFAPVDTYWDLGIGGYLVVVFMQSIGLERRIIDCYATHGTSLGDVVRVLEGKGYRYGTHYLPHDAKARELQTGISREDFLKNALRGMIEVVPRVRRKEDAIDAFRLHYKKLWIDSKAENLITALEQYCQEYDDDLRTFKAVPRPDWASHYADAAQCWALAESRTAAMAWPVYDQATSQNMEGDNWDNGKEENLIPYL